VYFFVFNWFAMKNVMDFGHNTLDHVNTLNNQKVTNILKKKKSTVGNQEN
jgi:hypothetical protein